MSTGQSFLTSTIGKKYLVAIAAIVWCLFVMVHMLGNMLIFFGPMSYNKYSHQLTSNPFIYVAETLLLVFILLHAFLALSLKIRNFSSKPKLYAVTAGGAKASPVSSKTMAYTGLAILGFLIWHLATFKFGDNYVANYNGVEMRDIYTLIVQKFHQPYYVVAYVIAMGFVGMHLYHGVKSIFQSLGVSHPRYNVHIKMFGYTYAIVVALGFISQPLYVAFFTR